VAAFPPSRQSVVLVAAAGKVPEVDRIEAPTGVVARVLPGPQAAVEVGLAPGTKPGPLGDVLIHLADAALPVVRVPVFAVPARAAMAAADAGSETRTVARAPLPFDVLVARLGRQLRCTAQAVQTGGFKDERTQLTIWLAERLCDPATAERQARRTALGGMSAIEYARARDEVTLRLQRDPEFKVRCEQTLAVVGTEGTGEAGK
jgi:hypothetical protein